MSEEQKRLDLVHNERTKLTATWVNNVGVGTTVVGAISPLVALGLGAAPRLGTTFLIGLIWFLMGLGLHLIGRFVLKGVR